MGSKKMQGKRRKYSVDAAYFLKRILEGASHAG